MRVMSLGESERQPGAAESPLPGAHEVQVREEAHAGALLELEPETCAGGHAARGRAGTVPAPGRGTTAERRRRKRGEDLLEVEIGMRLLDPGPLIAVDDAAREADVLEPAILEDRGLVGAELVAHEELLGDGGLDDVPGLIEVGRALDQGARGVAAGRREPGAHRRAGHAPAP